MAQLASSLRASVGTESDWTIVLRAISYALQRVERESFVIVRTDKGLTAGRYTRNSWAGRTPSPHDLYLEEVWLLQGSTIVGRMEPHYGVWLAAETIKDVFFAEPAATMRET